MEAQPQIELPLNILPCCYKFICGGHVKLETLSKELENNFADLITSGLKLEHI